MAAACVGSVLTARFGMLGPRLLGRSQNPSPQDSTQFSYTRAPISEMVEQMRAYPDEPVSMDELQAVVNEDRAERRARRESSR